MKYGFLMWLVSALSGITLVPFYMTIATKEVIYWTIQMLALNWIMGAIVAAIYKK